MCIGQGFRAKSPNCSVAYCWPERGATLTAWTEKGISRLNRPMKSAPIPSESRNNRESHRRPAGGCRRTPSDDKISLPCRSARAYNTEDEQGEDYDKVVR